MLNATAIGDRPSVKNQTRGAPDAFASATATSVEIGGRLRPVDGDTDDAFMCAGKESRHILVSSSSKFGKYLYQSSPKGVSNCSRKISTVMLLSRATWVAGKVASAAESWHPTFELE